MRKQELQTPVVPAYDYARDVAEAQRLEMARKRDYDGMTWDQKNAPEVPWHEIDDHLAARRRDESKARLDPDTKRYLYAKAERVYEEHQRKVREAVFKVKLAERTGVEADPEDIALAAQANRDDQAALLRLKAELDATSKSADVVAYAASPGSTPEEPTPAQPFGHYYAGHSEWVGP